MADFPNIKPGQGWGDQSAAQWNQLVDAVRSRINITGAGGVMVSTSPRGVSISMKHQPQEASSAITGLEQYIVREIENPDGQVVRVERAVWHEDYSGQQDIQNLGRWIAKSESGGGEPVLEDFFVLPHWLARWYEPALWPVGTSANPNPTTRATDILSLERIDAGRGGKTAWYLRPNWRLFMVRLEQSARVGSCQPWVPDTPPPPPGGP